MSQQSTPSAPTTARHRQSPLGLLLKYGVPAVITVGLCYLLVKGMDLREMWHTI